MGTNYIAPIWRMPRNANKDKLSNYSMDFQTGGSAGRHIGCGTDLFTGNTIPSISISVWINTSSNGVIMSKDRAVNGTRTFLFQTAGNQLYWQTSVDGNNFDSLTVSASLVFNDWHHVVVTYNAGTSSGDGEKKIYIDGSEVADSPLATYAELDNNLSANVPIEIGRRGDNSRYFYDNMSQVCIFDYALSTDQIGYLYNLNNPMVPGTVNLTAPVAYWPLGDNSNPNANRGFPNISVGADSVFDFNTSGAWIDAGNNPNLNVGTGDLSISAWVYPTSVSGNDDVIGIGANSGTRIRLQRRSGRIGAYIDSAAGQSSMDGTTSLSINQWYHFVLIKAGSNFDLYLNGSEVSEASYINAGSFTDTEVAIGQYFGGFGNKWAGELSNIQIWNSALTTVGPNSDLETLYNNGQPLMTGTQPQEANLTAWYKLNQTANWEADTVGNWQIPDARSAYPQSFGFNGSSQRIKPGTDVSLGITDAITVSAWVKIPTTNTGGPSPGIQEIICEDAAGGSNRNWGLFWRHQSTSNKYFQFSVWHTDGTSTGIQSTGIVPNDGKWHHVIGTFDGTTNANGLKLYVDNTLFQTTANGTGVRSTLGVHPSIGSLENGATWMFEGNISNVYVWETDLNSTQVETLYNNGVPSTSAVDADNLKLWYKLDNTELFDGTNWIIQNQKTPANYESALYFTGGAGNEHLETPSNSDLLMAGSHSFSVWLNVDDAQIDSTNYIFDKGSLDYSLGFAGTALRLIYYNYYDSNGPSGNNKVITLDPTWKTKYDSGWNHVVVSVDQPNLTITVTTNGTDTTVITTPTPYTDGNWLPEDYVSPDQGSGNLNIMSFNGVTLSLAGYISNLAFYNGTILTTAEALTLYNNGTPENNISFSPTSWWKIDNTSTGLLDNAGSANLTNTGGVELDTYVTVLSGISSGMTEQNLVNNNVSVLNGESSGMNSTNLVQSNLTKKVSFSSYSTKFDGIEYYTDTGGGFLNGATTASVSVWMKLETIPAAGQYQPVISSWDSTSGRQYLIRYRGGNGFEFYLGGPSGPSSTNFVVATSTVTPVVSTWYNVVGTWDGSEVKIYINGAFGGSEVATSGSLNSTTAPNQIGRYSTTNIDGYISNTAFWADTVLNEDDILNIYNNGVTQDLNNFRVPPTNWLPLDESYTYFNGSVMVARDVIGGGELDGVNVVQSDMVGNAPGSQSNGAGSNFVIGYLEGNMKDSKLNAYSINMADYADGVTNPASSGRSTDTP